MFYFNFCFEVDLGGRKVSIYLGVIMSLSTLFRVATVPVRVVYSDTPIISTHASIRWDEAGEHYILLDDDACASFYFPRGWEVGVRYGWCPGGELADVGEYKEGDEWLIILPPA